MRTPKRPMMKNTGTSAYAIYSGCPLPALLVGDGVVSVLECNVWLPPLSTGRNARGCVRCLQGKTWRPWEMFTVSPRLLPKPRATGTAVGLAAQAHRGTARFELTRCHPVAAAHQLRFTLIFIQTSLSHPLLLHL